MRAQQSTLNHTITKCLHNEEGIHIRTDFFSLCAKAHTHIFLSLRPQTHSHTQRHTEIPSDISSLIQPLIDFGHRAQGVMKDRSNKRQTGGRDKERWGSETRRGSREESQFGRNL